jgi:hypothetical protein
MVSVGSSGLSVDRVGQTGVPLVEVICGVALVNDGEQIHQDVQNLGRFKFHFHENSSS